MRPLRRPVPFEQPREHLGGRLRFGRFEADLDTGELRVDGRLLDIEPQPRRLLLHLIRHRHRVVSRPELEREVWGYEVSADALGRALLKARRAIGDDKVNPALRTVPRVGYRFTTPVHGDGVRTQDKAETTYLAFLPFENATGDPGLAWVRLGLPLLVGQALPRDSRVSLMATSRSPPVHRAGDMANPSLGSVSAFGPSSALTMVLRAGTDLRVRPDSPSPRRRRSSDGAA